MVLPESQRVSFGLSGNLVDESGVSSTVSSARTVLLFEVSGGRVLLSAPDEGLSIRPGTYRLMSPEGTGTYGSLLAEPIGYPGPLPARFTLYATGVMDKAELDRDASDDFDAPRHGDGANVLALDGHVAWTPAKAVSAGSPPAPQTTPRAAPGAGCAVRPTGATPAPKAPPSEVTASRSAPHTPLECADLSLNPARLYRANGTQPEDREPRVGSTSPMLWREAYDTRRLGDLPPFALEAARPGDALLVVPDLDALGSFEMWRRLVESDFAPDRWHAVLLGPRGGYEEVLPPSRLARCTFLPEASDLPLHPTRVLAAVWTPEALRGAMIGPPTEEAWDEFAAAMNALVG